MVNRRNGDILALPHLHHFPLMRHDEEQELMTQCCVPSGCLHTVLEGGDTICLDDLDETVRIICNNDQCDQGQYMHKDCFQMWEISVLTFLKSCGRARSWSEKQRLQNLWTKKGYDLAFKACSCRCGKGHIKKDLDWIPPKTVDEAGRRKKKQQQQQQKQGKVGIQPIPKRSDIFAGIRNRANSLSSNGSTASSSSSGDSPTLESTSPTNSFPDPMKRAIRGRSDSNGAEKTRNLSGGLFTRRPDFSAFNSLPRHLINSYHIKLEDETNHSNDEARNFILTNLASNKLSSVNCLLCAKTMHVYDRFPLIDGTFFLSPRQHSKSCVKISHDSKVEYLGALCMACLHGWTARLDCRWCQAPWDGSMLVLGTMYAYDVFAAAPCCSERLKCNKCSGLVITKEQQRFASFSAFSRSVTCPQCRTADRHFVKPLPQVYTATLSKK